MSKLVLVVEDNPVNLELLREILQNGDYQVVEAGNGQEALVRMEEAPPDLILLDVNMPVVDGFETIRRIRRDPRFCRLPVVAVTAYAMKDDREKILAAGFDSYVSKPIDPGLLLGEAKRFTALPRSLQLGRDN
jgi:CheY-like chemotaxis protein